MPDVVRRLRLVLLLSLLLPAGLALPAFAQVFDQPPYDSLFYGRQGAAGVLGSPAPFQQVQESLDPFTGNVTIVNTDVALPGNGGLDLKIQRSYHSRLWGRRDGQKPGFVGLNELSVMGIG